MTAASAQEVGGHGADEEDGVNAETVTDCGEGRISGDRKKKIGSGINYRAFFFAAYIPNFNYFCHTFPFILPLSCLFWCPCLVHIEAL